MPVRDLLNAASTQGAAPSDPYFYDVSLLLNGDGTNGAQNNTFLDSSSNAFTITRNGNTTQGSFSPYGNLWSNYFGSGNYLTTPSTSALGFGTGNFTIECWVNFASVPNNAVGIINGQASYTPSFYYDGGTYSTNKLVLSDRTANQISVTWIPTAGVWYHLAAVRNGTTYTIYVNGVSIGTASNSNSYSGTATYTIGGDSGGGSSWGFPGYISNLRVTGSALYNGTFTPSITPLTAISGTQLLTCQSNRFIDNSSNAFVITVQSGSPSVQRFSPFNPTAPYSTTTIGGSGYFDGSSYLSYSGTTVGLGAMTFECWFFCTGSFSGIQSLIGPGSAITGGLGCNIVNATTVSFDAYGIVGTNYTVPTIAPNTWNHIAFVRNSSNVETVFLNGVRSSTGTQTDAFTYTTVAAIGYTGGAVPRNFTGYISNARLVVGSNVYDPTQTTITVPTAPLTAIANTQLLCNMVNAGIPDLAMQNDLQTVGSAQVSTSVVKYGTGSISFSGGSGDYLCNYSQQAINSTNFGTGDFTIEMWIYFNSTSGDQGIIDDASNPSSAGTQKWFLHKDGSGNLNFGQHSVGNILSYSWSPSTGTWYYITITRASGTAYMFINGSLVTSASNSTNFASSGGVQVGIFASGNSLNGYIDDLRITNGYARYTSNFTPPTSALPTY